ncbi:MAG: conjugal transfer protein TraX [Eubacterium sp.]|nr:conjugal transfer protein TraX [Eubacterium sp.]
MKQNIPGQNGNTKQQLAAQTRKLRGISGSTLKLIAVITMIIDHVAAGILIRYLFRNGIHDLDINNMSAVNQWMDQNAALFSTYNAMRLIGRIAFPIYCFLLVQGFEYTHNRLKYAARLLMFAAISEIPFDLLFKGQILEFGYQNVFFTLFFGLAVMMGLRWVEENLGGRMFTPLLYLIVIAAGMAAAQLAKTDYAAIGVLCIVVTYLFRKKKIWQIVSGCIVFSWELTAPLAYIPIAFYNGKRGWKLKYFFYLVYPVHLFVLYLICMGLGIDSYPAM